MLCEKTSGCAESQFYWAEIIKSITQKHFCNCAEGSQLRRGIAEGSPCDAAQARSLEGTLMVTTCFMDLICTIHSVDARIIYSLF